MTVKKRRHSSAARPIIRLRSMLLTAALIAAVIAGPLLMVWKQAYFASASLHTAEMADSLNALSREITTLRLKCERLSSKERIERIAQTALELDYPPADRIVIVKISNEMRAVKSGWQHELMAILKKSLGGNRG
ncbi:MAG: cell division protein FtsL [Chitinispirillaceae bacterium]|nr:cell division protein FtsL [Chitinispirillaceae bacterium]